MPTHRQGCYVIDIEQTENKKAFCVPKISDFEFIIAFVIIKICLSVCVHVCTSPVQPRFGFQHLTLEKQFFQKCMHTMSAKSLLKFPIIIEKLLYQYTVKKRNQTPTALFVLVEIMFNYKYIPYLLLSVLSVKSALNVLGRWINVHEHN